MAEGLLISETWAAQLAEMTRQWKRGLFGKQPGDKPNRFEQARPNIAFALVEDLESGGNAQAMLLRKTKLPLQIVTLKGNVTGGSFRLHYGTPVVAGGPEESGAIQYDATADEMKTAVEEMESVEPGDIAVTFGKLTLPDGTTVITGRWLIEFLKIGSPQLLTPFEVAGEDTLTGSPNLITTETHFLTATGKLETVHATTPVPDPTPMEVGAIGQAQWIHGIGYSVIAIECRDFSVAEAGSSS